MFISKATRFRLMTGHDKTTSYIVVNHGGCLSTMPNIPNRGMTVLNDLFVLVFK